MKNKREKVIVQTSLISVLSNLVLVGFKVFVGFLSHSIAILSDAVNNLSDALSSIITIVGIKLAGKTPDKNHPYGYGRIEYMSSFLVSATVLYAGVTTFIESIKKIIHPETPDYQVSTLLILLAGILIKFILGFYEQKKGKEVSSDSLVASGLDAFDDAILSVSVFASACVYLAFGIQLEAYVGAILSVFSIRMGIKLIRKSVDHILGVRVETKLAKKIKKEVEKEDMVSGSFDLILNNYGPDKYYGSIHIEVPDTLSVAEVDKISRNISNRVLKKFGVILHTIGIYSVNTKDKEITKIQKEIYDIVFAYDKVLQMHGFYIDMEEKSISFDIITDFSAKNREEIYRKIVERVEEKYPDYRIHVKLDIDMSD